MALDYRVQLDVFSGPLDLLLYLIKRDELDIQDISIVRVTQQFLDYVRLLEQLDPNTAGDFLVMASTLIEIKSRALLPTPPLEALDDEEEARVELVRQLLEYKRFKDAARSLGRAADDRAQRFSRRPADLPDELRGVDLEDVEVWDLLTAFGRVMSSTGRGPGLHEIRYDDTPIEAYVEQILERLAHSTSMTFQRLFSGLRTREQMIGLFLALLELMRKRRVSVRQERMFGEIFLLACAEVDEREPETAALSESPVHDDAPPDDVPPGVLRQASASGDAPSPRLIDPALGSVAPQGARLSIPGAPPSAASTPHAETHDEQAE